MAKFTIILLLAFYGNSIDKTHQPTESSTSINFSNQAIDFESGQPVFSKETAAFLSKLDSGEVRVFINDSVDIHTDANQINLSDLIDFSEGTYTVVVQGRNYEEVFAFTIR